MIVVISVMLSAIGIGLMVYSLFSFILSLTEQRVLASGDDEGLINTVFKNKSKLNFDLRLLGFSLILILVARMILSLSLNVDSELFYYGIFINVLASWAIAGIVIQRFRLGISELVSACSVLFVVLLVFILDNIFL